MLYTYCKRKRDFKGRFIFYLVLFVILWGGSVAEWLGRRT